MTTENDSKRSNFLFTSPENVGIPSQAISNFLQALKQKGYCLHAFMLMRNGQLCFSTAAAPYTLDTPHRVFSTGKSILVLSVYFAIQEGYLHFEDRVAPFFKDILGEDPSFDTMSVRDLLTMRSGQVDDAFPAILTDLDADLIRLFFQTPLVEAPGQTFRYNNTIPHIVYALVERATGIPFEQYQNAHLCKPLDAPIYAPTNTSGQYNPVVMSMSANTLLKFAQFYLQEGTWGGQSLLGAEYIREAIELQTITNLVGNGAEYGYQIWRNAFGGYRMDGGWGQYAIILPQENLAAVILSDMPDSSFALEAFEKQLLTQLSPVSLPVNTVDCGALCKTGDNVTLAPEGGKATSANEDVWCKPVYRFADIGMEIQLHHVAGAINLIVTQHGKTETFQCGLEGNWLRNSIHLLVKPERTIDNGVYCLSMDECLLSGTWQSDQVFTMIGKSLGALGHYWYRFTFSNNGLMLEYSPHVCRGSINMQNGLRFCSEGGEAQNECTHT